jgi:tetratricopeptide (TPR) repeat protein
MPYEETLAAFRRGDNAEASRLAKMDLEEAVAGHDREGQVQSLCMLARVALRDGRLDDVDAYARQARDVALGASARKLERMPLHLIAVAARMAGRYDESRSLYLESIRLSDELGETVMAAVEHRNLAYVELRAGDPDRALTLIAEARSRLRGTDQPSLHPYLLFDEATEAAVRGDFATAAAKLADVERLFAEQGVVPDPDDAFEMADLRQRLAAQEAP